MEAFHREAYTVTAYETFACVCQPKEWRKSGKATMTQRVRGPG